MKHSALKLDTKVSFYTAITDKKCTPLTLETAFEIIQSGKYEIEIQRLRNEPDKRKRDAIKTKLPSITPSGLFEGQRKKEHLKSYSDIIHFDFDDVKNVKAIKNKLTNDEYCLCTFISPSGNGLKVFAKVIGGIEKHLANFNSISQYFSEKYQLEADVKCSDITRLMFLSYDKELILNRESKEWHYKEYYYSILNSIEYAMNPEKNFIEGNRNQFIFDLACKCRDKNIPIELAKEKIEAKYNSQDFEVNEIVRTIQSAYSRNSSKQIQESKMHDDKNENQSNHFSMWDKAEEFLISRYELRNNIVSNKVEYRKINSTVAFVELNEHSVYRELQKHGITISFSKLCSMLNSDFVQEYNPIADYFNNLSVWDEETEPDYILKLTEYIPIKNKDRFIIQFKKMLVRCIACALDNDVFNKQVFVLVHDMQNSGKSTFCRWLCPPALSNYLTENVNTDKDSIIALASNFLINMDELATLSKAEINSLKSMISRDKINVRLPYGKRTTVMPRRANFIGSTNKDEFLTDETGSVRWLCFELTDKINFDYNKDIDINNIWRQAYTLFLNHFHYQLTQAEIAENEKENQKFQVLTAEFETIPIYFSPSSKEESGIFLNTTAILNKISINHPTFRMTPNSVGKALKQLGYKQTNEYNKERGYTEKGYYVRELK